MKPDVVFLVLIFAGVILAAAVIVQSHATSLVGWAILAIGVALLYAELA